MSKYIMLLAGQRGVGKTTVCQRLVEIASRQGYRLAGVLTPALFDQSGAKVGFEVVDAGSGERRVLARADSDLGGPRIGRYSFDLNSLSWACDLLQRALASGCDLLIVDEIGPLELERGQGFLTILRHLQRKIPCHTLLVVRSELLNDLRRHLPQAELLYRAVTPQNRDTLPWLILEEFFSR
ncbi:MAG TPA: hypothetical protein DCP08_02580 [Chloroflexi bacterium]|nr:hypothetical protein [Chloroflexota bacterium]